MGKATNIFISLIIAFSSNSLYSQIKVNIENYKVIASEKYTIKIPDTFIKIKGDVTKETFEYFEIRLKSDSFYADGNLILSEFVPERWPYKKEDVATDSINIKSGEKSFLIESVINKTYLGGQTNLFNYDLLA